ncbi:DNA repair protein-like protein [Leptomonas seymouri]|uniref:RanBP-type and C3HC4-type zinc finger-containing protein 1 n=1 Tax=Leptomonas seymouri TaxID=5684 RepID=A0A0N1PFY0_LEPSE|nr:DNA repair protein-like protein [Leptomonas seymouri]|eukprot:KPI89470.1 DNA repair protein-like protein [Leptomonas seymouri]
MDDVDAFLASLDRFSAPTIDAGIQRQQSQQVCAQGRSAATQPGERSSGVAYAISRRRPRSGSTESEDRPCSSTNAEPHAHTVVDVDSPTYASDASSVHSAIRTWWCVRCSAENSRHMQSCAVCHRRRHRVEGPRPHLTAPHAQQPAPQLRTTSQQASSHVDKMAGGNSTGWEPDVFAGPGEVSCPRCTFLNPSSRRACGMCEGPLPLPPPPPSTPDAAPILFSAGVGEASSSSVATVAPSAAALAAVPSVTLPGLGSGGATRPSAYTTSRSAPLPQTLSTSADADRGGSRGTTAATLKSSSAGREQRTHVMQEGARETLQLSRVAIRRNENKSGSDTSSESDEDSSAETSDASSDSDWDGQQTPHDESQDHRELVRFLETLQSVQFDDLPLAAVPTSMRVRAQLRPFQLQALYWLLKREQQQQQPLQQDDLLDYNGNAHPVVPMKDSGLSSVAGPAKPDDGGLNHWLGHSVELSDTSTTPSTSKDVSRTVRGGIFADFMGLGKTRTLISLCEAARAPHVDRVTGSLVESTATLIVCPTSLLTQWVEELRCCVERPASTPLRILVYYGARKRRLTLFQVAQSYDYVITTYQTLTHEQPPLALSKTVGGDGGGGPALTSRLQNNRDGFFGGFGPYDDTDEFSTGDAEAYNVDRHLQTEVGKLFMIRWARIILDEAHYIRNMRTRQSRSCLRLSGVCKWAVTATPVLNSLNDLYPLLRFLEVPHFSSLQWWNDEIVRYFNQDPRHPRPVTALSILFRSILLRRTPDSLVDGKPILDLPPKRVVTHTVALSREETQFYKAIHTKATEKLNALRQRDAFTPYSPLATFTTAFEMLVRCRQTCLHPYIVVAALRKCHRPPNGALAGRDGGDARMADTKSEAAMGNGAALLQAQREQQQRREAEQRTALALDQFIQCVVLRRLRITKANEFVQSLVDEIKQQKLESRECIICLDTVNRPAILPCAHVYCEECITHALEATRRCPLCKRSTKMAEVLLVPLELLDSAQLPAGPGCGSCGAVAVKRNGHGSEDKMGSGGAEGVPPDVPADLDLTNVANWGLHLSSKTSYLVDTITRLPPADKVVVFSTFLTYLRYAQHWLEGSGIACAIYSGSMTMKQKGLLLERFRDAAHPDSPRVLLATTSSCGVGLNLTCANHCFLMEPSWNSGTEEQALNRIHRIGQTKPVTVIKLVADGTIEQNISQLCERKRALSGYCFGSGGAGGGGDGRLRTADLLALFAPEEEESSESSGKDDDSDEAEGE